MHRTSGLAIGWPRFERQPLSPVAPGLGGLWGKVFEDGIDLSGHQLGIERLDERHTRGVHWMVMQLVIAAVP